MTLSFVELHLTLGVPWWALVPLVTFAFRASITLPLAIMNRKRMLKQQQLRPIIDSMYPILKFNLMRKTMLQNRSLSGAAASSTGSSVDELVVAANDKLAKLSYEQVVLLSAKEKRSRQKKLYRENKCQVWKNLALPVFQVPLWLLLSLTIRDLSGWNSFLISSTPDAAKLEPSLVNEGLFWVTDLSHSDPYGVLPVVLGIVTLTNVELLSKFNISGAKSSTSLVRDSFLNRLTIFDSVLNVSRLSVIFFMGIASQAPAVLALYWISSNLFSLAQNLAFQYVWPLREGHYSCNGSYMINDKNVYKKSSNQEKLVPFVDNSASVISEVEATKSVTENENGKEKGDKARLHKSLEKELDQLLQLEVKSL